MTRKVKTSTKAQIGSKHGFRSGLEDKVAGEVTSLGYKFDYEGHRIHYVVPERKARYTPDFPFPHNGIIVETKGRFLTADRQKHLFIKAQCPDLDIRFVFSNSKTRISKQSLTTYAAWCETHGFLYADKSIPQDWLKEPPEPKRMEAFSTLLQPVSKKATTSK